MAPVAAVPSARPATPEGAKAELRAGLVPKLAAASCAGVGAKPIGLEIGDVIGRLPTADLTALPRHYTRYKSLTLWRSGSTFKSAGTSF